MFELGDVDFKYSGVEYDYRTENSCVESGCDSICRCGVIVDECVIGVDVSILSNEIYNMYFDNSKLTKRNNTINSILYGTGEELDRYCIDRILRSHKVWLSHNWDIVVEGGYYGQEIGHVRLESRVSSKIQDDINEVISINTNAGKVEFVLNLEYGYILPELDGCNYEIVDIDVNSIIFGSIGQYKKVQSEKLEHYIDIKYSGPRGVVKKDGDKYKIIDGYHRIYAAGLTNKNKVGVNLIRVILVKDEIL